MRCQHIHCALNEELLTLLPFFDVAHQQAILQRWSSLRIDEREEIVQSLRRDAPSAEPDFKTLAKLAAFLGCDVIDVVRYLRADDPS